MYYVDAFILNEYLKSTFQLRFKLFQRTFSSSSIHELILIFCNHSRRLKRLIKFHGGGIESRPSRRASFENPTHSARWHVFIRFWKSFSVRIHTSRCSWASSFVRVVPLKSPPIKGFRACTPAHDKTFRRISRLREIWNIRGRTTEGESIHRQQIA